MPVLPPVPHRRLLRASLACLATACLLLLSSPASAKDDGPKEQALGIKGKGKVFASKSKDGVAFHYRVPKSYDAERGAGLTLILHGSNLDRRWGFANHAAKSFRPDDIVVSPNGTTPNGRGGYNFLEGRSDLKKLKGLIAEFREAFNVRGVYLYGHSQGSFFAFLYAGAEPDDVNGVVGHASGVWTSTRQGKAGHHQAIVLMHGTQDPVVPYVQSLGGYTSFQKAKYPKLHLRTLEGWNHWPAEHNFNLYNQAVPNASQQLAWVEGMTTDDPERMEVCLDMVADSKFRQRHDYGGAYKLAQHLVAHENAPEDVRTRATKVIAAIEALAEKHVEAIQKSMPEKWELDDGAWVHHLPMFLRTFEGVPACDAFRETHAKALEKQEKAATKAFGAYWKALNDGDAADGIHALIDGWSKGYLYVRLHDYAVRKNAKAWRKDAADAKVKKKKLKAFDTLLKDLEEALEDGQKAFDKLNQKHGKL